MNLELTTTEQRQVHDALADILGALDLASPTMRNLFEIVPARDWDRLGLQDVRAYFGTIRDAFDRLDVLLFPDDAHMQMLRNERTPAERQELIERAAAMMSAADPTIVGGWLDLSTGQAVVIDEHDGNSWRTDQCDPHGLDRDAGWSADSGLPMHEHNRRMDSYVRQLEHGLITRVEFDRHVAELHTYDEAAHRSWSEYPGQHPCDHPGCEHTVLYDDEPYCFTHSPDEGSSLRGYSYQASQR